jgi:hypothetical protein
MAASLMIWTGRPNAFVKSKPTHPGPRFFGSATGLPCTTGPGNPIDTASKRQSAVAVPTRRTIFFAVIAGPDGILTVTRRPVTSALTWDPPTSMTKMRVTFTLGSPRPDHHAVRLGPLGAQHEEKAVERESQLHPAS